MPRFAAAPGSRKEDICENQINCLASRPAAADQRDVRAPPARPRKAPNALRRLLDLGLGAPRSTDTNGAHTITFDDSRKQPGVLLDVAQMAFDIVGSVDPTPVTDSCGVILAVSRGRWLDASFSVVGLIPYIGDLVKLSRITL